MRHAFLSGHAVGRRGALLGALVVGAALIGHAPEASADAPPKAEVMVIHATKCDKKSVDPRIGDTPPALGYDCLKLVDKKTLPLTLNQASTTALPNGRTFQLLHTAKVATRYKVTASISPADGSAGFTKLADITADPNKPFNVGGFSYQGGVLVLTVRIVP
ncbi:MAG: hypothetical protein KIS78_03985 [Labilithrix sp.]|nr:hypothetical protein [Labilithrix sp.]MCW5831597.1 hypothetical protein [Labilithrix sp.]